MTHAVLVFAAPLDPALAAELLRASEAAGIELLRLIALDDLEAGSAAWQACCGIGKANRLRMPR